MALEIIFSILMLFGILLTVAPMAPGLVYMFFVTLIYGIFDRFETFDPMFLLLFGGFVAVGILTDYLSGMIGAKFGGASKKSLLYGLAGLVIGFILMPPFGAFIGLFAAIFLSEIIQFKDKTKALRAAGFSVAGSLVGVCINISLAIAAFVSFLIIVF